MYLTGIECEIRLGDRFNLEYEVTDGDAEIASQELDAMGPFIGSKLDSEQENAFPRSINPDGTENVSEDPPAVILDLVALSAYRLAADDAPALSSRSVQDLSESYAVPRQSQAERRMAGLAGSLSPYLLRSGRRVGESAYPVEECP